MVKHPRGFEKLKKRHRHTVLTQGNRRSRITAELGDNFVGIRQCGDKIEILTKDDISPGVMAKIEKIWRHEE